MYRIAIIGHYGADSHCTDGQTIKVRSLVSAIHTTRPDVDLRIVDTYYFLNKRKIYFGILLLTAMLSCKRIVFFPAARGRQSMFYFFYVIGRLLRKKVYHNCIAGSLDEELSTHPSWLKYLNSFEYNWMESPEQVHKLKELGVKNAVFLPNFKNLEPVQLSDKMSCKEVKFNFCIFSRILPMKGVEDAVEAIQLINEKKQVNAHLDIYGPIEKGQEKWFEGLMIKSQRICSYKGIVPYDESVETLKDYFALLFPTRFYTEGMPGTIIDAMFSGLPVIARKWKWCDNMIINGYNGISYSFENPEKLKEILMQVVENPMIILNMKANCIKKSEEYSPQKICRKIYDAMGI